jgi:hypothetical protein
VPDANLERAGTGKRALRRFDIGKELVIRKQMPNGLCALSFNRNNAQQTESTLELKDEVVAWCKWLCHGY